MNYRSLLSILDLSDPEVDELLDQADAYLPRVTSGGFKDSTLKGVSALLLFYEASTRTRVSFELAGKMLGVDTINVGAKGTSVEKGETLADTVMTLDAMGFNILIMRHPAPDSVDIARKYFSRGILNAGSGRGQHPTQALLDAQAMRNVGCFERGKHLAIVGDLKHSRVMRSNLQLLTRRGIDVTLVSPPGLMPEGWEGIKPHFWSDNTEGYGSVNWTTDLDSVICDLDAIMMLRMQRERMGDGHFTSIDEYSKLYGLNGRRLKQIKPDATILHPGPVNRGVEVTEDVFQDPRCVINDQVASGVALRCALMNWCCMKEGI